MFFVTGITAVQAQTPRFEFKSDFIDYGDIAKGSDGIRVFEFKNVGDAPLIIENVYSSCGCTVPTWPKNPIAPGKTGEIKVKYDTDIVGPIRKTISIYSNAEESPKAIKIKGRVLEPNGK